MNIPELYEVIQALKPVREVGGPCTCEEPEPTYHEDDCESMVEVRLQVTENDWVIHHGDPSYDTDHHGHWGATTISSMDEDDILDLAAQQLLNQVEESIAEAEAFV